jgi:hypothetical protein
MSVDLSEVELGFVVSLRALRETIKELNIDGRRRWISSDPHDAAELGYVTLAHGCEGCIDRLNTLHFRVPVLFDDHAAGRTERLILFIDPSTVTAEEPGYYLETCRTVEDPVEDLFSFYTPLERALIARIQARN